MKDTLNTGIETAASNKVEYRAWQNMKHRCYNPNHASYKNYGARGIKVCDEWMHDFTAFYRELGPRPSDNHSIDRIDNDGHYEPGNVRWATRTMQQYNRRLQDRNTSGYKGVSWFKVKRKWIAYITLNRKFIFLGSFKNIEDAAKARRKGELKYYGDMER